MDSTSAQFFYPGFVPDMASGVLLDYMAGLQGNGYEDALNPQPYFDQSIDMDQYLVSGFFQPQQIEYVQDEYFQGAENGDGNYNEEDANANANGNGNGNGGEPEDALFSDPMEVEDSDTTSLFGSDPDVAAIIKALEDDHASQQAPYDPMPLVLPTMVPPPPPQQQQQQQQPAGDALQRTVEAGPVAEAPLQSSSPVEPVSRASPASEDIVDRALAPKTKKNRVSKKKAASKTRSDADGKPAREVRAGSCDACRKSKTKCRRVEGAAACERCMGKGIHECLPSDTDGRTHKTTNLRYNAAVEAVNDYLVEAVLLCRMLVENPEQWESAKSLLPIVELGKVRQIITNNIRSQPCPLRYQNILRLPYHSENRKLQETRTILFAELRANAKEQATIVADLLLLLTDDNEAYRSLASGIVAKLVDSYTALADVAASITNIRPTNLNHPFHQTAEMEVEKLISTVQG
ncbi:hypothetical protein EsH8_II_000239 [Colletotrichum jinshuiense]